MRKKLVGKAKKPTCKRPRTADSNRKGRRYLGQQGNEPRGT